MWYDNMPLLLVWLCLSTQCLLCFVVGWALYSGELTKCLINNCVLPVWFIFRFVIQRNLLLGCMCICYCRVFLGTWVCMPLDLGICIFLLLFTGTPEAILLCVWSICFLRLVERCCLLNCLISCFCMFFYCVPSRCLSMSPLWLWIGLTRWFIMCKMYLYLDCLLCYICDVQVLTLTPHIHFIQYCLSWLLFLCDPNPFCGMTYFHGHIFHISNSTCYLKSMFYSTRMIIF